MLSLTALCLPLSACGDSVEATRETAANALSSSLEQGKGSRDNTPDCLTPVASGTVVYENDVVRLDCSNTSEGYIIAHYLGSNGNVKLQITGKDNITYTYDLKTGGGAEEVFPLSSGDGQYQLNVYENIENTKYAGVFSQTIEATIRDQNLPYLYPNQYVMFDADNKAVALARELAMPADSDLQVVTNVYDYIISHMTYDYEEAETADGTYIPDVDEVLESQKGICLDYSSLMCAMLRSQRIPTRMEIGYAGTTYHAWISTYIDDIGWVNGLIEFDGTDWSLMDPTLATTTSQKELKSFISDSDNYQLRYIY